ncbi:cell attachment protein [Gierle apodemus virus]|uniref:Cell attachment protein n=1 Tax=Gierle apodemus virus TaxID=2940985 RepID=A0AAE9KYN9_9MONO|nr:cell attachment protein [Gierle apodemus virus]
MASVPSISESYYKYPTNAIQTFQEHIPKPPIRRRPFVRSLIIAAFFAITLTTLALVAINLSVSHLARDDLFGAAKEASEILNKLASETREVMEPELLAIVNAVSVGIPSLINEMRQSIINVVKTSAPITPKTEPPTPALPVTPELYDPFGPQWQQAYPSLYWPIWTQGYRICASYSARNAHALALVSGYSGISSLTTNPYCEKGPVLAATADGYALTYSLLSTTCTQPQGQYFEVGHIIPDNYNRPRFERQRSSILLTDYPEVACSVIPHPAGAYFLCTPRHNLTTATPDNHIHITVVNMDMAFGPQTFVYRVNKNQTGFVLLDLLMGEGAGVIVNDVLEALVIVTVSQDSEHSYACNPESGNCDSTSDQQCRWGGMSYTAGTGRAYQALLRIHLSRDGHHQTDVLLFDPRDYAYPRTGDEFYDSKQGSRWFVTDNGGWHGVPQLLQATLAARISTRGRYVEHFEPPVQGQCGNPTGCANNCTYRPMQIPAILNPLGPSFTGIKCRHPNTGIESMIYSRFNGGFEETYTVFPLVWALRRTQTKCFMWNGGPWCMSVAELIPTPGVSSRTLIGSQMYNPYSLCDTYDESHASINPAI